MSWIMVVCPVNCSVRLASGVRLACGVRLAYGHCWRAGCCWRAGVGCAALGHWEATLTRVWTALGAICRDDTWHSA